MGICAVWGPPQSGKTTLAIDMAFALSMDGQSVCLISPELYSELSIRLNTRIMPSKSLAAVRSSTESIKQLVHTVDELLYVLAVPIENDAFGEEISEEKVKEILNQAIAVFDHVIVDCPSHAGSVMAAWALNMADDILLLTGGKAESVLWSKSYKRAIAAVEDKLWHICVEVNEHFDYHALNTLLETKTDVWLPHVKGADLLISENRSLYLVRAKGTKAYSRGVDDICYLLYGEEDMDE